MSEIITTRKTFKGGADFTSRVRVGGSQVHTASAVVTPGAVGGYDTVVTIATEVAAGIYVTSDLDGGTFSVNEYITIDTGLVLFGSTNFDLVAPVAGVIKLTVTGVTPGDISYTQIVTGNTKTVAITVVPDAV